MKLPLSTARRDVFSAFGLLGIASVLTLASSCSHENHALLPQGSLDAPANGTVVGKSVGLGGWALSEDGVANVGIYLDRRYRMDAVLGGARPDVKNVYPQFPDAGNSGWSATLVLDNVAAGPHAIEIQIRSKTGGIITRETNVVLQ